MFLLMLLQIYRKGDRVGGTRFVGIGGHLSCWQQSLYDFPVAGIEHEVESDHGRALEQATDQRVHLMLLVLSCHC